MDYKSVAIDGPSGAGKSTIARIIADKIGYIYVDTGAIYRAVGLFVRRMDIDPRDPDAVTGVLEHINISLSHDNSGRQLIYLNGEDITDSIRTPEISMYASDVSAIPEIRKFLLSMQRHFAVTQNVIMDGRDIGTVVLPGADLKIFLTASPEERAKRRYDELILSGQDVEYEKVLSDIIARDKNDSERAAAPLVPAEDSITLDTTGNTLEKSVSVVLELIYKKLRA